MSFIGKEESRPGKLRNAIDRQIPYVITCTEQACASTQHIYTNAVLTGMQAARRSIVAAHNKADLVSQDARHRRVRMKPMEPLACASETDNEG